MKKDFDSRFMPDVYFKMSGDVSKIYDVIDIDYFKMGFSYFYVSYCGTKLFPVKEYQKQALKEVSIYEAIPELIPDGMRYDKELDKLVPDVVSEYVKDLTIPSDEVKEQMIQRENHRAYNVGSSNYSSMKIQPWDVWRAWKLDPWDADVVKRISRTKEIPGKSFEEARIEDYEKIKHICDEKIYQLKEKINAK